MGDCTFARLGPYKFHTFLLRLLLSSPLTAKCAQLHGGCGAVGRFLVGGMAPLGYKRNPPPLRPLACPALQLICIFGCAAGGRGKGHKGSEQKLGFGVARMPAFPLHVLAVGHLWHPSGIPQEHHAQHSPAKPTHCHQDEESTIAAPQKLSHFLYA